MYEDNNVKLNLKYKNFQNNNINWETYSREVFDSIQLEESSLDLDFKKDIYAEGVNPFIEEEKKIKNTNNEDKTLESKFIESWDSFKLKELQKVAEYYEIPYKGKTKNKLIEKIIEFEENEENSMKVYDREVKWSIMNELSNNKFFNKYIINWNN